MNIYVKLGVMAMLSLLMVGCGYVVYIHPDHPEEKKREPINLEQQITVHSDNPAPQVHFRPNINVKTPKQAIQPPPQPVPSNEKCIGFKVPEPVDALKNLSDTDLGGGRQDKVIEALRERLVKQRNEFHAYQNKIQSEYRAYVERCHPRY